MWFSSFMGRGYRVWRVAGGYSDDCGGDHGMGLYGCERWEWD